VNEQIKIITTEIEEKGPGKTPEQKLKINALIEMKSI